MCSENRVEEGRYPTWYLRFIESAVSLRGEKLIVSALNAVILFVCCSAVNSLYSYFTEVQLSLTASTSVNRSLLPGLFRHLFRHMSE